MNSKLIALAGLLLIVAGSVGGCVDELERGTGSCQPLEISALECNVDGAGNPIAVRDGVPELGAYACSGTARPDDGAVIREGVPAGRICSDVTKRPLADGSYPDLGSGKRGYCCNEYETSCARNPQAVCPSGKEGYQCRGSQRPETYNPTIYCDQAIKDGDLLEYCCGSTPKMSGSCVATAGCPDYLTAWTCRDKNDIPRAQELLASKSRTDVFYMTCATPTVNTNGTLFYCCFIPGVIEEGGTCTQHTEVPGCAPGRFGWACLGPDTPDQDYPAMANCESAGAGPSMEGYPAALYCCDFVARR